MNPLLFTEPAFLVGFLPIVFTAYWLAPARWRDGLLLAASLCLYAWGETRYVAVLLGSIVINWLAGSAITSVDRPRLALTIGVTANLALLTAFKFFPVHQPAGLSFYTFIAISYLVDLYRRDLAQASSLNRVGLLLSMFPHLIAGPIVRMTDLGRQFGERYWNSDSIALGIRRFVIGLGKKVLIANSLAMVPDEAFALPVGAIPTVNAWLALICYSLQIYFDFSGYSDMAIGLARMFGFHFPENFNLPYVSRSISEFWRRWHITLSNWLRDYLFFPLGAQRSPALLVRNLLIVFGLCGLWHGAAWTFVAWGLWHGLLLSAERLGLERILKRVPAPLRCGYTLLMVALGWVLFRSPDLPAAFGFLKALAGFGGSARLSLVSPVVGVALVCGAIGALPLKPPANPAWTRVAAAVEFVGMIAVCVASFATIAGSTYKPFIYFRF